jgi:hypothetical protein
MAISNKQRPYGQLLVDFANAGSTDEAGLKYFENVQKVFGFPSKFTDKAKANFPTINNFHSSLTDREMQCFKLILEKKNIEMEILSAIGGEFLDYDIYSQSFYIREAFVADSENDLYKDNIESPEKKITIEELKEIIQTDRNRPGHSLEQKSALKILPKLIRIGKNIFAFKDISEVRYKELSECDTHYEDLISEHWHIENTQKSLKLLLDEIIKSPLLSDSKMLKEILLRYNETPKFKVYLSDDGTIKDKPFSEDFFLNRENIPFYDYGKQFYSGPISYCVVEFFKDLKNIKYLKKCKQCKAFIIIGHIGRQFCDEPKECKKIFYNQYRTKRMREEYRNPDSPKFKVDYLR